MKPVTYLLAAAAAAPLAAATTCIHNNCLRAIIASSSPNINGTSDCQSVLLVTQTSTARTFTTTVTVTDHPAVTEVNKRDGGVARDARNCVPAFPTYASACSSVAAYISACSCVSVTPGVTTTTVTPTATITVAEAVPTD